MKNNHETFSCIDKSFTLKYKLIRSVNLLNKGEHCLRVISVYRRCHRNVNRSAPCIGYTPNKRVISIFVFLSVFVVCPYLCVVCWATITQMYCIDTSENNAHSLPN